MSDDTLSQLVAVSSASNLRPLVGRLRAVFAAMVFGTATLVSMWHDLKHSGPVATEASTRAGHGSLAR